MNSPSPSSSAVTIPTPGKSILKKPPPPQQSFFSLARLSKLLPTQQPNQNGGGNDEVKTLKRAHFILPEMTTVYPILAANPPSMPNLKEEKRSIEEREAERRKRVVRRNSVNTESSQPEDTWWSMEQVESFYRECCIGREEEPDPGISKALLNAKTTLPRTVDLSGVQLTVGSASVLSDIFTIEWGLRKLVFKECDLDELTLKPMLHALLIPETLTFLSVASNRRLKAAAFRVLGAYLGKAKSLQFLDMSQNTLDKKAVEYLASALPSAPEPGLVSLRLDDCGLRPTALDALAHVVRTSSLRNISLRHNKINATGAVALALMIKDYPDRFPVTNGTASPTGSPASSAAFLSPPATPTIAHSVLSPEPAPPPTPPPRVGPVLPPPRHPSTVPQTTYTPYIPRAKRAAMASANPANVNPLSPTGQQIPIITSSAQGGITTRHPVNPPPAHPAHANAATNTPTHGPSAALLDKVRALDALPRLGALRTLDLKGNDIRTGITYIAQVLKRNRTLKVLNLSENKLDVQGLVVIAEALKYNSCLETLDLSKNPCCGPSLEGVQSLRTAFTLNDALKRLFLSSTGLQSAGAIALAEFLPESTSLLHLDLTMNTLDLAGVMALSSGLKANHVMRCLDLNIPPADEEMARMCRDILNTCVRNTEDAEKSTAQDAGSGRGKGGGVWGMIEESELAKTFRQEGQKVKESLPVIVTGEHVKFSPETRSEPNDPSRHIIEQAKACKAELEDLLSRSPSSSSGMISPTQTDPGLTQRTRHALSSLGQVIVGTSDQDKLAELLALNDDLTSMLSHTGGAPLLGLGIHIEPQAKSNVIATNGHGNGSAVHSAEDLSDSEEEPVTPRVDKGKGRAAPEPEEPEMVLTPTIMAPPFMVTESDEEDAERTALEGLSEDVVSPTDRSRSWVAEEGEVFRKGTVLLTPEEMEGEYDSEELRKEILEAMVERPPPRSMQDGYIQAAEDMALGELPPSSPQIPSSPIDSPKPPPRPYIRRSRSSSNSPAALDIHGLPDRLHNSLLTPTSSGTVTPLTPSPSGTPVLSRSNSFDSR
ncbi:RNI-like protein [Cristinia sonorae]|uniref:RNI-like protein n=1 Tax=Cristinia sonorae TaxID=1940300 RepID=A0A8K0XSS1_9AGAR|nr:RNI-like protein [Cristinia sonorae]